MTKFLDGRVVLHPGDCRDVLRGIPDNSIDSVVTDPPYALVSIGKRFGKPGSAPAKHGKDGLYARASAGFMGQQWDTGETAFAAEFWADVLRVLKPGGHVVAFSGTRTYHRMAVAIEDAGFEIRDQLAWTYGSGFPKSHDVSKGIDKKRDDRPDILRVTTAMCEAAENLGITRSMVDDHMGTSDMGGWWLSRLLHRCQCPTPQQWTRLRSLLQIQSREIDDLVSYLNARKGEFGENWQAREVTGEVEQWEDRSNYALTSRDGFRRDNPSSEAAAIWKGWGTALKPAWEPICLARKALTGTVADTVLEWGTGAINVGGCRIEHVDAADLALSQAKNPGRSDTVTSGVYGANRPQQSVNEAGRFPANLLHDGSRPVVGAFGDEAGGSAARFFYTAKAGSDDRIGSKHPTVKPVDLMQWLCRLITPPGGTVLDPFAGTGTTGEAAWREGFNAVLIERETEYQNDIAERMRLCLAGPDEKRREIIKRRGLAEDNAGPLFGGVL